ncbi:MAG: nucleotidyltransferase domain-containing protein [Muribaculum sp.]|uniref:Nucleotidyltransferase domain-containing protein n=1 Tax=Candidatus Merdivivens faecigallinarum TaxID=2840871 RepID=A0A9D9J2F5_9BACT|nr:nucleotidyltransferase domain-containing protein [Candidatus Merdivivens faecigallinarum]
MAGYGVEKLILFGSRARNEATEDSDRNYPWVRE